MLETFIVWIAFICTQQKINLKRMKKHVKMPNENNKILKYNPGEKSLKVPFIICADLECLLEK